MTLRPGDILSMGTSSGVGIAEIPPRLLKNGDVVEVWIDGIPGTNNVIRFLAEEPNAIPALTHNRASDRV